MGFMSLFSCQTFQEEFGTSQLISASDTASTPSLVFLYKVQIPLSVNMSVTYISSLSFDARKRIISALDGVIPCQELCVPDFLIFV